MTFLLDVNVLVALLWTSHQHHSRAMAWFRTIGTDTWATCPMTQCGAIRICSNPKIMGDQVSPQTAMELLARATAHPRHEFWTDDVSPVESAHFPGEKLQGHQQIADAYLLSLCLHRSGSRLATLDEGILEIARNQKERHTILQIP